MNRGPADCTRQSMLSIPLSLTCLVHDGFGWRSGLIVPLLFPSLGSRLVGPGKIARHDQVNQRDGDQDAPPTRFAARLDEPHRTMVLVDAITGMRVSELLALKWSDVDLQRRLLSIRQSYYRGNFGPPKNRSSERTIPLSPGLVCAPRCHKLRGPQSALDSVFPNAVGQPYEAGNLLKSILYPAFAALGLPKTGWRVFRRYVATALSEIREPARTAQQALGHSSPQTTLAFYVQLVEESQGGAIGRSEEQTSPNVPKNARLSKLLH